MYLIVQVMEVYVEWIATFPESTLLLINHLMLQKKKIQLLNIRVSDNIDCLC